MRIKPRAIATALCMIFFIGFAALLFGGLAITVVTIQTDEEEYEDE